MRETGGLLSRAARRTYSWLTETNAVLGQDPAVKNINGAYVLPQSAKNDTLLTVRVFKNPDTLVTAKPQVLWVPPHNSDHNRELWAPKLVQAMDEPDKWDLVFSADDGDNRNHRTYALRSKTSDPLGPYGEIGRVYDRENDYWAIDIAPFDYMGRRYAIWSGVEHENQKDLLPQNLYIAEMLDPVTLGPRRLLSAPEYAWEQTERPINEGPGILKINDKFGQERLFVAVSADASWTSGYKLGLLELKPGSDPLRREDWIKYDHPVMIGNGIGHPSFTENQGEWTIWYHEKTRKEPGWRDRVIRHKKIGFDPETGVPILGKVPVADIVSFPKKVPVAGFTQVA